MNPSHERTEACIETMDNTTSPWMAVYHALPCAGEPTRAAHGTGIRTKRQAQSASQPDSDAVYPSRDALSATMATPERASSF
jgi:hypothetical protein